MLMLVITLYEECQSVCQKSNVIFFNKKPFVLEAVLSGCCYLNRKLHEFFFDNFLHIIFLYNLRSDYDM